MLNTVFIFETVCYAIGRIKTGKFAEMFSLSTVFPGQRLWKQMKQRLEKCLLGNKSANGAPAGAFGPQT